MPRSIVLFDVNLSSPTFLPLPTTLWSSTKEDLPLMLTRGVMDDPTFESDFLLQSPVDVSFPSLQTDRGVCTFSIPVFSFKAPLFLSERVIGVFTVEIWEHWDMGAEKPSPWKIKSCLKWLETEGNTFRKLLTFRGSSTTQSCQWAD